MHQIKFNLFKKNIFVSILLGFCLLTITGFTEAPKRPILELFEQALAIRSSDPDLSQQLLFKLNYRREELTPDQRLELVYLTGYLESMRGKYYRALDVHKNLTLAEQPHLALRAYGNMLTINILLRDYGAASQYIPQMIEIIENDSVSLPRGFIQSALITIISFYNHLNQYEQANVFIKELDGFSLTPREQCFTDVQRTQTRVHLKEIMLTDKSIIKTQKLCLDIGEKAVVSNYIADLAHIYIDRGMYQGAINILQQEIIHSNRISFKLNVAEYNAYLAYSYMQLSKKELALKYALETLEHIENLKEPLPKTWAYNILYKLALEQGNNVDAIKYLNLYSKAYDEYKHLQHLIALGLEQDKYDLESIRDDIALYSKELQLNNAMYAGENKNNDSYYSYYLIQILLEILFVVFLFYQFNSIAKIRKNIKTEKLKLIYDPLSQAYHRHDFIKKSNEILTQQKSLNSYCGLLILNLDDITKINFQHNSDRVDWVIKYGIKACLKVCTANDILGRLGGDEFAILMTGKSLAEMSAFAEQILQVFQQLDTSKVNCRFATNCSIGLTDSEVSGYNLQQLVKDAGIALQTAKAHGKNKVVYINDANLLINSSVVQGVTT